MQLRDRRFFGLLGEVVDGNPTEEMLQACFAAARLPWKYISIPVAAGMFPAAVTAARQLGFAGLHVTKPYKIAATRVVDELTPAASAIGAVNCMVLVDGAYVGDNTDGRGLVRALSSFRISGSSVVVLGAGGAARAVAVELALAGAREIVVCNRSEESALSLVAAIRTVAPVASRAVPWRDELMLPASVDLVVNATSIGMLDPDDRPKIDLSALRPEAVVADAVIAPRRTALLKDAAARGLRTVEGTEMLVKQAAISFELWATRAADESVLRAALAASWA